jgi:hypothetical protein
MERVLSFFAEHPELAITLFVTVGWPLLTGLASFVDEQIAARFPMVQALLRSAGFDAKRFLAVLVSLAANRARLPIPPEVLEVAAREVTAEKPKPKNDNDEPPDPPSAAPATDIERFFAPMRRAALVAACLTVFGCGASMDGPKLIVNGAHDTLTATEPVLRENCTTPAAAIANDPRATQAQAGEVRDNLVRMGCPKLANAYDSLRTGYLVGHATITAIEAGVCMGVSKSADGCDLAGALLDIGKASADVADKARGLRGGK